PGCRSSGDRTTFNSVSGLRSAADELGTRKPGLVSSSLPARGGLCGPRRGDFRGSGHVALDPAAGGREDAKSAPDHFDCIWLGIRWARDAHLFRSRLSDPSRLFRALASWHLGLVLRGGPRGFFGRESPGWKSPPVPPGPGAYGPRKPRGVHLGA